MKRINYISLLISFTLLMSFVSCEDWLEKGYENPDAPPNNALTENVYLPGVLGSVTYELTGGMPARESNYWLGQIAENAAPPTTATFNMDESDVNNTWTYNVYTGALKNNVIMTNKAKENGNFYYQGIGNVITAYILGVTSDLWGDIPWSQAFKPLEYPKPVFDTQAAIYTEIMALLTEADQLFAKETDGQIRRPGADDLLYGGNIASWRKLSNTLKARFAIHLTYAPGKTGTAQADIALAALANGFATNNDDADFEYFDESGSESPWNQWHLKWTRMYANEFIYELMDGKSDPRIADYFDTNEAGEYVPHRNGNDIQGETYAGELISFINENFRAADLPISWITYAEAKFIAAEAYLWKGQTAQAQAAFADAIRANMTKVGIATTDINAYITALGNLPANFEAAQRMIIEEKYVANFLSLENWNDYRRTGYPLVSAANTDSPTHPNIPLRWMYPSDVRLSNAANMPDVDWLTDRLWWDAKSK